jgi:DNA repair protein RadC
MTAKHPDDLRSKGNIEAASSVIANWLEDEQPRARMARYGAAQMSTAELLALCLASGLPGENAVLLSQRMLKEFGSVHALLAAPIQQLLAVRGVGPAKAARLKAIHELSVRETEVQLKRTQSFSEPAAVARFLRKRLGHLGYEAFGRMFLNAKHEHIAFEILFPGSIDRTHVHAREVLKRGLELNAAALIVCHNHPSGNAETSQADIGLTRSLFDLLEQVERRLLDHVVVSVNTWVSLQLRGLL